MLNIISSVERLGAAANGSVVMKEDDGGTTTRVDSTINESERKSAAKNPAAESEATRDREMSN